MVKKAAWNWFGVKIIKQIVVQGEPVLDEYYKNDNAKHFEEAEFYCIRERFL